MTDKDQTIRQSLRRFFQLYVPDLVVDPEFEFEITDVKRVPRETVAGEGTETVWVISITTNSRAKLLGQFPPFEPGRYRGLYENLLTGRAMQFLFSEFDRRDFVELDVTSTVSPDTERETFTRDLSLSEAVASDIVPRGSPLHRKMEQYGLDRLRLEGGSFISGPILDTITAAERALESLDVDSIFDCYCGVGTVSLVACERGVDHSTALDLNVSNAERHLAPHLDTVDIVEGDVYSYVPDRSFDLLVADPYYSHTERFLTERFSDLVQYADNTLLNLGYVTDRAWCRRLLDAVDDHLVDMRHLDTGRHQWVLARTA